MPSPQHRHIGPWTINNPTEEDFERVRSAVSNGHLNYVVFCHEIGETGTYHLQGYAQAPRPYTMKKWHEVLSPRFATGSQPTPNNVEATIQYCKGFRRNPATGQYEPKRGSAAFEEYGTPNKPGHRTDIAKMKAAIDDGATLGQIQMSDEYHQTWIQMPHATREYVNTVRRTNALKQVLDTYEATEWKPWQAGILEMIEQIPDSRTITWIHDEKGNIGKSHLTTYLAAQDKAYCPDVTKLADILYGYNYQPIVIFDIPRSKQEHMEQLYTAMEQFKNGRFFAGKYESKTMVFKAPHVIVFANFPAQKFTEKGARTLSEDRWIEINLDESMIKTKSDFLEAVTRQRQPALTDPNDRPWKRPRNVKLINMYKPEDNSRQYML